MASVTFISRKAKMGLEDLLAAELGTARPKTDKLTNLLERLAKEEPEECMVLDKALNDSRYRHATLTKVIRKKYGHDAVGNSSVRDFRMKHGIAA